MRFVLRVLEVGHAINARKGGGVAAVAVCIELFLRQDVPTGLRWNNPKVSLFFTKAKKKPGELIIGRLTSQEKDTILSTVKGRLRFPSGTSDVIDRPATYNCSTLAEDIRRLTRI